MDDLTILVIIDEIANLGKNALTMGQNIDNQIVEHIDTFHRIAIIPVASVLLALFAVMQIYRMVSVLNNANAPQGGSARYETLGITFAKIGFIYMLILNMKGFIWGLVAAGNFLMQKIHEAGVTVQGTGLEEIRAAVAQNIENKSIPQLIYAFFDKMIGLPSIFFLVCFLLLKIAALVIFILFYSRLLKIYIMVTLAPIPIVTFLHEDHKQIGTSFIKSFCAVILQGAVMLLCIYIYSAIITITMFNMDSINAMLLSGIGIAALLVISLATSGKLAKSLINAM